ncbi:PRC-barrel domain containing protein [bacterium]|nr:PRC-barrel domain containing protein [bacterium]NCQ55194.1 PRC-barrel domain containing protein [Candidatus Parcubacteria bacterium]NCS67293.1 PRC-barrel domain containing protein [Candidatus Peregrinibacteria bacterium]NCS96548.1 PRC-barrel domain containing protein [bacterium]
MLTTFKQSYKTIIQSKNDDLPTGLLLDMVVNPDTGVFEAFWVKSLEGQKLLLPKDIISWDSQQITINDSNDLSTPEDLPRLRKTFEKECPILKARVYDQAHKKYLGTVSDFTFDTISPRLLALEVEKNWFGFGKHRIPQHRIIKIKADKITVDSSVLKTEVKSDKKIPVLDVPELDGPTRKK